MSETANMSTPTDGDRAVLADARFAWLTLLLAAWLMVAMATLFYAVDNGLLSDVVVSVYHLPYYLAIVAIGAVCLALIVRAQRDGRGWRKAFPQGYGVLGAGFVLLAVWPIVEIGWREGVGLREASIEQFLGASRIPVFIGGTLVAIGPLRAALALAGSSVAAHGYRWPATLSAALVFVFVSVLGFLPAQDPWLESARNEPQSNTEIWVMNQDGSGQSRLIESSDGFGYGNAVWSPDGTQIAYNKFRVPERSGVLVDDQSIWVASADGSSQRLLVEGVGWYWLPHWSPDGQWIVYTVDGQRGPGAFAGVQAPDFGFGQPPAFGLPAAVAPNVDIWRIRADGSGAPERLTDDPSEDRAGVYSPDGQHLLFDSTRSEGRTAIYGMDADGSNVVRLTSFGDDWGGTWAPDGMRIAFNADPGGGPYDIWIAPSIPGRFPPTRLTDDPGSDFAPTWSPDGSRVAFISEREGQNDVWSVGADGSDLRNLSNTPGASEWFTSGGQEWSPDDRILYERSQEPPAASSMLARENLAIAEILLASLVLTVLVLAVVRVGAPFGAVAVITGLAVAFAAIGSGEWRFVVAAVIGGLIVDILIRLAPSRRKSAVAGAGSAAALVLGSGLTVIATTGMAWTPTLLLGVTMIAGLLGLLVAALLPSLTPVTVETATANG